MSYFNASYQFDVASALYLLVKKMPRLRSALLIASYLSRHLPNLVASCPGCHLYYLLARSQLRSRLQPSLLPATKVAVSIYPSLKPATHIVTWHTWLQSTVPYCQLPRLPSALPNYHLPVLPPGLHWLPFATYPGCHLTYIDWHLVYICPILLLANQVTPNLHLLSSALPYCHLPMLPPDILSCNLPYLITS